MNVTSSTNTATYVSKYIPPTEEKRVVSSFDKELEKAKEEESDKIDAIIKEYRAQPGMDGIYVEGTFEKDAEDFIKRHEEQFKKDFPLYEKYKDIFTPMYSNYTSEKADKICKAMDEHFPDYQEVKNRAFLGGTDEDKAAWEDMFYDYQAYNKYLREINNLEMTGMGFSEEATRAYNLAVYEQLESGIDIGDAKSSASSVAFTFGGGEAWSFSISLMMGLPKGIDELTQATPPEDINYDKQIDLRDVGFEHNFSYTDYTNIYGTDAEGILERLLYDIALYSFLNNNEDVVDQKIKELKYRDSHNDIIEDDEYIQSDAYADTIKKEFSDTYKNILLAKNIYDKYSDKIFAKNENGLNNQLSQKSEITKYRIVNSQKESATKESASGSLESLIQQK